MFPAAEIGEVATSRVSVTPFVPVATDRISANPEFFFFNSLRIASSLSSLQTSHPLSF